MGLRTVFLRCCNSQVQVLQDICHKMMYIVNASARRWPAYAVKTEFRWVWQGLTSLLKKKEVPKGFMPRNLNWTRKSEISVEAGVPEQHHLHVAQSLHILLEAKISYALGPHMHRYFEACMRRHQRGLLAGSC